MTKIIFFWTLKVLWFAVFLGVYYLLFEFQYKWYRPEISSIFLTLWLAFIFFVVAFGVLFIRALRWIWIFAFISFWVPIIPLRDSVGFAWPILLGVIVICILSAIIFPISPVKWGIVKATGVEEGDSAT